MGGSVGLSGKSQRFKEEEKKRIMIFMIWLLHCLIKTKSLFKYRYKFVGRFSHFRLFNCSQLNRTYCVKHNTQPTATCSGRQFPFHVCCARVANEIECSPYPPVDIDYVIRIFHSIRLFTIVRLSVFSMFLPPVNGICELINHTATRWMENTRSSLNYKF